LCCGALICVKAYGWALGALLLSRLCDGLDGAVARLTQPTDFGGYLDIICDFLFYAFVPFCFAISHPDQAGAAAFLMLSFVGTGSSFLAYAILDAKLRVAGKCEPKKTKSFAYLGGLTEGTETIFIFVLILFYPAYFSVIAVIFGLLCWFTTGYRVYVTWVEFGKGS
jgi:phosphatidylglycerophosphate synthase